jgi:multisubunit Na+/H+ antiporter MnhG subunit
LLLLSFPFAGILLAVLIMASDIAINIGVTVYFYYQTGMLTLDRLPLQIAFGIFVFLTSPVAWKTVKRSSRDRSA